MESGPQYCHWRCCLDFLGIFLIFLCFFQNFLEIFWEFIGGISIFVWVEASARLAMGTGAAASVAPERVTLNSRWGGAS